MNKWFKQTKACFIIACCSYFCLTNGHGMQYQQGLLENFAKHIHKKLFNSVLFVASFGLLFAMKSHLTTFLRESNVHGFSYIVNEKINWIER